MSEANDGADYRQMEELEQERMELSIDALCEIHKAGFEKTALFFACELGVRKQFQQAITERKIT